MRKLVLLSVALVAGVVWASVSLAAGDDRARTAQADVACVLFDPQPAQPLEMNTVVVAGHAKTVAMEKELFDCRSAETGDRFARDVETFVEIVERASSTTVTTVARRVIVATCDKNFDDGSVSCRTASVALGGLVGNALSGCEPPLPGGVIRNPADPVEMNTVVMGDFIKTIKLEKEVLECGEDRVGDVYLFTELIERRSSAAPIPVPFSNRFDGIMCFKDTSQGAIVSCNRVRTQ